MIPPLLNSTAQSVYLSFRGRNYYTNTSEILITQIGFEDTSALACHTDRTRCCRGIDGTASGEWKFPNGDLIPSKQGNLQMTDVFLRSRGPHVVNLLRKGNVVSPLGIYCCEVPDMVSVTDKTFCANIIGKVDHILQVHG